MGFRNQEEVLLKHMSFGVLLREEGDEELWTAIKTEFQTWASLKWKDLFLADFC